MTQAMTHSRAACFRTCPRKHQYRYEFGLRRDVQGYAARVGSAFHAALDANAKGQDVSAAIEAIMDDPYDMALVAAMYQGHLARWANYPLEVVASELPFSLPMVNPESGRSSRTWEMQGVIDRIVRLPDGRLALGENKTTSRDFVPGSDYWTQIRFDQQISIYIIAARALGYDVETVLYDVTRRPALRPLKATPEDKRKYKKDGTLYANQRDKDETPEAYAARVAGAIKAEPEKHFARIEIARLDADLAECQQELWQQQKAIRTAQIAGHWYRNPQACFSPFQCDYLDICGMHDLDTTTPDGFVRVEDIHPEVTEAATAGS